VNEELLALVILAVVSAPVFYLLINDRGEAE